MCLLAEHSWAVHTPKQRLEEAFSWHNCCAEKGATRWRIASDCMPHGMEEAAPVRLWPTILPEMTEKRHI